MTHRAKKSLGQNFLKSKSALNAIVGAGNISTKDTILEIGPGTGALTEYLLATGAKIIAVEKDKDLITLLEEKFQKEISVGQLKIIEKDILKFEPGSINLKNKEYKIIANIPYYITGAILEKFLEGKELPERMVLLVQKEVATRIVARDGKESILSISVKVFGKPKIVVKVPNTAFSPAPKVDSAVLLIENISQEKFEGEKFSIGKFFTLLKVGFAHKRKLLARNLETVVSKEDISRAFLEITISRNARAENLKVEDWISLAKSIARNS